MLCSCISLQQLDPEILLYDQYSLSLNTMIFRYTSESNITNYIETLKAAVNLIRPFRSRCEFYGAVFVYNFAFIPCNLTTGTPRPVCSSACYTFRDQCEYQYSSIIIYSTLFGYTLRDNCENIFYHISDLYAYPNSSRDFENDCLDFLGMYKLQ